METNWKQIYKEVLKNFCSLSSDNVIAYVNLEEPKFADKLIPNEDVDSDAMYSLKLDETQASKQDYKDFCYYVFESNGYNFDDYYISEEQKNKGDNKMEKIKSLLKKYGASDNEINNFINDLQDLKEDIDTSEETEEKEFNYLDKETMEKLKSTDKGKDLILKAPTMDKKELRKAIKDYLKE